MENLVKNNQDLLTRTLIYCKFLSCFIIYFIIALLIESIPCPQWITQIDDTIPFIWWMIIPYYYYYIILVFPLLFIDNLSKLASLTKALIETSLLCYVIYIIWPISSSNVLNTVSHNPLDFLHNFITFDFLHQNAFPSMHVSVTTTIALSITKERKTLKYQMFISIILIFFATFLIKQHYLIDSISGLLIGLIGYIRYKNLVRI